MRFNLPTCFTLFRILLIPFFVLAFYLPFKGNAFICAVVFVLAAVTDWFDGFLARQMKQITRFGAFLDPVADKIMVIVALALVVEYYHSPWITLPALIMMVREIIISALREWMAELGKRTQVSVSSLGKWKTAAQMTALIMLLWHPTTLIEKIGIIALYLATGLTFWSMFFYLNAARADLTER